MSDARATGQRLKESVEKTAAEAEAESPDGEPEPETEPAPAPDEDETADAEEQPAEPAEPSSRAADPKKQFDKAYKAFGDKLLRIFEVDELTPAPHPGVVGFMLPGFAEPRTHDNYKKCETCNGIGKVLTEANTGKEENDWHVCPDRRCAGRGYWEKSTAVEQAPTTGPLAVQPPAQPNGEFADAPAWLGDPSLTPAA